MADKEKSVALTRTDTNKVTRAEYFKFIDHNLDDYSQITFTLEEAKRYTMVMKKLSTGATAMIPLTCLGPACPLRQGCPLAEIGKYPIAKQCLVEVNLLNTWVVQYMNEYEVDPENFTEIGYCNELAEIEVMMRRLNISLAKPANAELIIDQAVGVANNGEPIIQKQLSPFMEQREKLLNRKSKIIKLMVGDRQEKYKKEAALKTKEDKDPSSKMSDIRRKIEKLQRDLDINPKATVDSISPLQEGGISTPVEKKVILTPDAILDSDEE